MTGITERRKSPHAHSVKHDDSSSPTPFRTCNPKLQENECEKHAEVFRVDAKNDRPRDFVMEPNSNNKSRAGSGAAFASQAMPRVRGDGGSGGGAREYVRKLLVAEGNRKLASDAGENGGGAGGWSAADAEKSGKVKRQ
jgi:hypothetical protein